jgi:hypothetical protein
MVAIFYNGDFEVEPCSEVVQYVIEGVGFATGVSESVLTLGLYC